MPVIDDPELAQLFRAESDERLLKLDQGLLQLEHAPNNPGLVDDLLREAHSLKGAARMLGLTQLQDIAHALEDQLSAARAGTLQLSPAIIQPQLEKVDQMRRLAAEALGQAVVSQESTPAPPPVASTKPEVVTAPVPQPSAAPSPLSKKPQGANPAPSTPQTDATLQIDTLRVEANRLDYLLSQTGELVVSRSHILRLQNELETLIEHTRSNRPDLDLLVDNLEQLAIRFSEDSSRLNQITSAIESGIRNLRLLPVSTLLDLFPRMVHDLAHDQSKQIDLHLNGGDIVVDKRIIEEMKAPLMHLLRNAVDHGIERPEDRAAHGKSSVGRIDVNVSQSADRVTLDVVDDGQGFDDAAIREQAVKRKLYTASEAAALDENQLHALVLQQTGFSTSKMITEVSGRGVGLNVVRTTVERMHGSLNVTSRPGLGLTVSLGLPVSLISTRVLMVEEWGNLLAIPFDNVSSIRLLKASEVQQLEGRSCIDIDHEIIFVVRLGLVLECPPDLRDRDAQSFCVILNSGERRYGVLVDALHGEQEVVLKSLPHPIRRARHLSGVTILDSGDVCPVLNVHDLSRALLHGHNPLPESVQTEKQQVRRSLLLAEDSITTRLQEKRILESAGYEVVTAVDGLDAWSQLSQRNFDAVVSDIMMPNMNGLELTRRIRADKKFTSLPIILVTSLSSDEDRRAGLEAGADAYLAKPEFDQTMLLECLKQLL